MSLTFKSETHEYFWNEKRIPGVSEILKETGQTKDWKDVPTFYKDRGTACHAAISLYLQGTLDEDSVDEAVRPYLEQFKAWDHDQPLYIPTTEKPFYSERRRYAGTVDLITGTGIYDIKCSKKLDKASMWQYRLQGAAYRMLVEENRLSLYPFNVLLLTGEGKAEVINLEAPLIAWDAVLDLYDLKVGRLYERS